MKITFTSLFFVIFLYQLSAQEKPKTFTQMRQSDFSKLIGGIQEGGKLSYNTEKTTLEGSGGAEIKKSHLFIQGTASIGTTTNLSALFDQKILPTFTGSVTVHYLCRGISTWFYDSSFSRNFSQLQSPSALAASLNTKIDPSDANEREGFRYKESFKEQVVEGKINAAYRLYTFKRFFWLSLTGKFDNTKYAFYDASASFDQQLTEPRYESWTGKLTFNGYLYWNRQDVSWNRWAGWRPYFIYFNLSAQYGLGNNSDQLKKTTVNDVLSSTTSGNTTRQTVKSQSAYNGIYKEFKTFKPAFELVFSPIRSFALNIFGEYNVINQTDRDKLNIDNFGSIATGIYFYGDGKKSNINIGAFYKWTRDEAKDGWTQQVGLKASIPITPI